MFTRLGIHLTAAGLKPVHSPFIQLLHFRPTAGLHPTTGISPDSSAVTQQNARPSLDQLRRHQQTARPSEFQPTPQHEPHLPLSIATRPGTGTSDCSAVTGQVGGSSNRSVHNRPYSTSGLAPESCNFIKVLNCCLSRGLWPGCMVFTRQKTLDLCLTIYWAFTRPLGIHRQPQAAGG